MDAARQARRWVLAKRPTGFDVASNLRLEVVEVEAPAAGQFLLRPTYLRAAAPMFKVLVSGSADGRPPTPLGDPVVGAGLATVVESQHPDFPVGTEVTGSLPWQDLVRSDGRSLMPVTKVTVVPGVPPTAPLHVLGGPGLSAWFGFTEFADARVADTVVVSTAAGAVGAIVCQLARLAGCRVVGITSNRDKADWLERELGVDGAIAYRSEDLDERLGQLCPGGVDVYFDNVGGATLDSVLARLAVGARVVLCGASSQYDREAADWQGPSRYFELVYRQASMRGFYIFNFAARFPEGRRRLAELLAAGKLRSPEDVVDGFDNAPTAFERVLAGRNIGVQLVRV